MNRRTFLALVTALPAVARASARAGELRTTDYLNDLVDTAVVPGAALMFSRYGASKFAKVVGTCCQIGNRQAKLTLDTIHPLYSFSKLITGTVVAMAVTHGRLEYSDRVSEHIPEFTGGGKDTITIRHCLTHSAGLAKVELKPVHDSTGWSEALKRLCAATVEWDPGSQSAYHGWSGSFLAAECVCRAYGKVSWSELCREQLFAPLGADSLSYEMPRRNAAVAIVPQPAADKPLPGKVEVAFGYAGHPGAGCFGQLDDILKLLHLHLQRGVWNSKQLIAPEVFREMHTVQFASEIAGARKEGATPKHEPWGLGPLLRGEGPACEAHKWFGFANQSSASIFGHAGINSFIGIGDLTSQVALVFATTDSPKSTDATILVRNKVADLVFGEMTK